METTNNARSYAAEAAAKTEASFKGFEPMKVPTSFTCRQCGELHLILTFAVCISALVFNIVIDIIGPAVHSASGLHLHLIHLPHHR